MVIIILFIIEIYMLSLKTKCKYDIAKIIKIDSITSICNILYFILLNIPAVIFIITNYIVDKKHVQMKIFLKE